jgi:hypothetical protein
MGRFASIAGIAKVAALAAGCAAAIYGALGILQALSLYQGARALWNVNQWSVLVLVGLITSALAVWPGMVFGNARAGLPRSTAFWLLTATLALWPLVKAFVAIDACLDAGGSYDSVRAQCSMKTSHPFIPLHQTHGFFIFTTVIAALLAALSFLSSRVRSAAPQRAA